MRLWLIIMLFPILASAQEEKDIAGTWIRDQAYTLSKGSFTLYDIEKHPYDTIKISENNTFEIRCSRMNKTLYPQKEERWTVKGNWEYRKKYLYFTNRTWTFDKEKIRDTKNKIWIRDDGLYINFGNPIDAKSIYVKYHRLK